MKASKKKVVKVRDDEMTIIELELDRLFIDFYKKETGRTRVSERGLSNFIQNLIDIHKS